MKNILFLTISRINTVEQRGLYTDLMRKFRDEGHNVYIVSPIERKFNQSTELITENRVSILKVWTLNLQKTNVIEKGVGQIAMEYQFMNAIKKYFADIKFDMVLYSTPPITFSKIISFVKKRDKASTYLLLKDIFPQNAVDLKMIKKGGLLYRYFRNQEKQLYSLSDKIGCMSPANVRYVVEHNKEIDPARVEICPNGLELSQIERPTKDGKLEIRVEYGIPPKAMLFLYGGNLGKPQGIDFLLDVLKENNGKTDRYFMIIGAGTEYTKIKQWFDQIKPSNAILLSALPKHEYDQIIKVADVGLIFLDHRFTIPNYPSRLLSYLENKIPVLAATDVNTDLGSIAQDNGYGRWCESGDLNSFNRHLDYYCQNPSSIDIMGEAGYRFLVENYTTEDCYQIIMSHNNIE